MDNATRRILEEWDLKCLINTFKQHGIGKDALDALTPGSIFLEKLMASEVFGIQIKFEGKLCKYIKTKKKDTFNSAQIRIIDDSFEALVEKGDEYDSVLENVGGEINPDGTRHPDGARNSEGEKNPESEENLSKNRKMNFEQSLPGSSKNSFREGGDEIESTNTQWTSSSNKEFYDS